MDKRWIIDGLSMDYLRTCNPFSTSDNGKHTGINFYAKTIILGLKRKKSPLSCKIKRKFILLHFEI
jgi:hypothetical protein